MPQALRLVVFVAALASSAARFFLARMPNAEYVPCVNNEAGCHGMSTCESFGHYDCFPFRPINEFGIMYRKDPSGLWTVDKCAEDSDGDGYTNGDELGDPCCEWQLGAASRVQPGMGIISNPAHASSVPSRPSCSNASAAVPASITLTESAPTSVRVWWNITGGCVCEYVLAATYTPLRASAAVTARFGALTSPFVLCGIEPNTTVRISIVSINRAGSSSLAPATTVLQTNAASGSDRVWTCTRAATSPVSMDTAGVVRMQQTPMRVGLAWSSVAWGTLLATGMALVFLNRDPVSSWRLKLMHTPLSALPTNKWLHWLLWDVATSSIGYVLVYVGCLATIIVTTCFAWSWFDKEQFFWGQGFPVDRAAGYALTVSMAIQLLPVTRWSVWLHVFGVPFERALRLHRWMGLPTFIFTVWHGAAMIIKFKDTPLGWGFTFRWLPLDAINPLAGVFAGLIIVLITAASMEPIRRRWYEVTVTMHALWPLCVAFSALHTAGSQGAALPLLLPGTLLAGIDFSLMGADWLLRPVRVISGGIVSDRPTDVMWHRTAYLVCDKRGRYGWVDALWPFSYACGQYVYLCIPCISPYPHPFSISSAPDPVHPGRFTVHIKSMGAGTWSDTLVQYMLTHTPEADHIPNKSAPPAGASPRDVVPAVATAASSGSDDRKQLALTGVDRHARVKKATDDEVASAAAPRGRSLSVETRFAAPAATDHPALAGGQVVYAVPNGGATLNWDAASPTPVNLPAVYVTGAFGRPSLQLENYRHFVLIGGGIGITPIAPVHYALARGYPVAPIPSFVEAFTRGYYRHGSGVSLASLLCGRGSVSKALLARATAKAVSLTTIWTTRDRSLLEAFGPVLGAEQVDASTTAGVTTARAAQSGTALVAGASPPAAPKTPRTPGGTPNPLAVGQKMALSKKWISSFTIMSNMVVETHASSVNVAMKVYLTSGRKKPATVLPTTPAATTPVVAAAALTASLPVGGAVMTEHGPVVSNPLRAAAGATPVTSTSPRGMERQGSLLRMIAYMAGPEAPKPVGPSGETVNVGADVLDETTASILRAANANVGNVPLPVVNRDRPNIPAVLKAVAEGVYASHGPGHAQLVKAQSFTRRTSRGSLGHAASSSVSKFVLHASACWSALLRFLSPLCFCRKRVVSAQTGAARNDNINSSPFSSDVDGEGRVAVAVVVCGPHEMVLATIDACRLLNAGPLGQRVIFHVHHEAFLM